MFRYRKHGSRARTRCRVLTSSLLALMPSLLAGGCLDRDISTLSPETTNLFITKIPHEPIDKIDVLFMIDNSVSMADKQTMLSEAVPELMRRLVEPLCTDGSTRVPANAGGHCPEGMRPEFRPVRDIHVAVISSSLGGFGSVECDPERENPTKNDRAHLIGTVRPGLSTYANLGFLAWDPGAQKTPPGEDDLDTLIRDLAALVVATGEDGCGYEASLESWYRFLVEPDPPAELVVRDNRLVAEGLDEELLAQRRAFLRYDSLVAIVMLSDENDCSIAVGGQGHFVGSRARLPRATAVCETNPNDPCCRPCTSDETEPPAGCLAIAQDPSCAIALYHDDAHDSSNVRCFDQKRRFGVDFLNPVGRYVAGLTEPLVPNRNGELVPNPLFVDPTAPDTPPRPPGYVFLAGILGVPWQDVATPASLTDTGLEYLTATELTEQGRWTVLLGDDGPPTDPFMLESIDPRDPTLQNPITNAPITHSVSPTPNPINGHDHELSTRSDLQYACTYPLAVPGTCDEVGSCDCKNGDLKSLCRDPITGVYSETQHFAKAYPGTRQLEVLRDLERQAIVASICPKVISPATDPSYGYNPAVQALIDRLGAALSGACLPRELDVDPLGSVPCKVIEALPPDPVLTPAEICALPGRVPLEVELRDSVERELRDAGRCDADLYPACADMVLCRITAAQDAGPAALTSCQQDSEPSATGFCYIDAAREIGDPALVAGCGETEQRMVRFVSADPNNNPLPRKGATMFIACRGKAFVGNE